MFFANVEEDVVIFLEEVFQTARLEFSLGPSNISRFFPLYCEGMKYCSSEVLASQQPDLDLRILRRTPERIARGLEEGRRRS